MKKEDAIKFLQQIYPNGGHCWLDEQRIEAIDMAIKALQEEPVSEDLEEEISRCILDEDMNFDSCARHFANWQKAKDESTTEDLGEYINELSKQFQEVSFAKLSRIAVRVSRWQRNQDTKNKLPEVINRTDLDEYAYQCAYDISNDWAIENPTWHDVEDACKLGANWQKEQFEKNRLAACDRQTEEEAEREQDFVMGIIENEHRKPTFDDAIKYGMRLQRENMIKDATDVTVHIEAGNYPYIPQMELYDYDKDIPLAKEGDKYKVVLVKEE